MKDNSFFAKINYKLLLNVNVLNTNSVLQGVYRFVYVCIATEPVFSSAVTLRSSLGANLIGSKLDNVCLNFNYKHFR